MSNKYPDQKKFKNANNIYPNLLQNKQLNNNKLSFTNALKNNTQKPKFSTGNINKKHHIKINNNNNYNEINEEEETNPINKEQEINMKHISINLNDDEDNQKNRKLHNVDSFKNIEFLLPKKKLGENMINSSKKIESNRRYINQGSYDYDGNANNNNNNDNSFGFDFSAQKKSINLLSNKKENTVNMNQIDMEEEDDDIKESDIDKKSNYTYSEDLEKLKRQEELIKKLLKYKTFQNYIKRVLRHKKPGINKKGKKIKWTLFKEYLYNLKFLDLYYKHRIPFIIMRPRLDLIKRKREKKQKEILARQKFIEEYKNNESHPQKNNIDNIDIKSSDNLYASIFQNDFEKNGFVIGEDNNTVRIEKRESLFPSRDGKPKGTFTLTKIPQKTDENNGNIRLSIAFNKAKDAARVVRRLEYSYSMRVNILLSKPIFQKNARIIQNWYRSMKFIKLNTPKIIKIQAFVRGMMIRKAFKDVLNLYYHYLPFLKIIDKILSRRYAKFFMDKLISKYGIRVLIKLAKIQCYKIINALIAYRRKQNFIRRHLSFGTKFKKKCVYIKTIYDWSTRLKIMKLQSWLKNYLMHNSEKILLKFGKEYNPKLYYYLKYGKNKHLLNSKLKKFRKYFLKFKELLMRIKYKKLGINNKYDFLKYIIRKRVFNTLKSYYKDSINNPSKKYQKNVKLRIVVRKMNERNNKKILKHYFNKWNLIANYLTEYRNILKIDKLLLIQTIMKYHKKFREKVFMLLISRIKENKVKNEKDTCKNILRFYKKFNKIHDKKYIKNLLSKAFKNWKRNAKLISINNAVELINRNTRLFLSRKKIKKKYSLINCLKIRNKKFIEKLRLWKFNAGKLRRHFNNYIRYIKKLIILRKIWTFLDKHRKDILSKYFDRFQMNTGVKKLLYINFQMCLYDENKKLIVNDKYSMMKYIKDQYNVKKEDLENKMTLKAIFNFWKSKQKYSEFKKKCKHYILAKCESYKNTLKLKLIQWNKKIKLEKMKNACLMIQRNYRYYKRKK